MYPDPKAPYSTFPDMAWLDQATSQLKWEPPRQAGTDDSVGEVTGGCPRCGHTISMNVKSTIAGIAPLTVAQRLPRGGVAVICNCLESHTPPAGKSGCGAGFKLNVDEITRLPGFPR